jgi:hypothetical protein
MKKYLFYSNIFVNSPKIANLAFGIKFKAN